MLKNKRLILEFPSISTDVSYLNSILLTSKIPSSNNKNDIKLCLFKDKEFLLTLKDYNVSDKVVSKYYPASEDLITISSKEEGLNVVDINKEEFIYKYDESISEHSYLTMQFDECPKIIALTESGLKFFDLRSRQSIYSINKQAVKHFKIDEINDNPVLLFNTTDSIFKYNAHDFFKTTIKCPDNLVKLNKTFNVSNQNGYFEEKFISDYIIFNNQLSFIYAEKHNYYLELNNTTHLINYNKLCKGDMNSLILYSKNSFATFKSNRIKDETIFMANAVKKHSDLKNNTLKEHIEFIDVYDKIKVFCTNKYTYIV